MNKFVVALLASTLPFGAAIAADKDHPPKKATEAATPEMKNPGGTDKLHPPQKAMDEATPNEKSSDAAPASGASDSSSGASSGTSGSAGAASQAEFPEWDSRKAGESIELKGAKQAE
jgi:hypothetical protein